VLPTAVAGSEFLAPQVTGLRCVALAGHSRLTFPLWTGTSTRLVLLVAMLVLPETSRKKRSAPLAAVVFELEEKPAPSMNLQTERLAQ